MVDKKCVLSKDDLNKALDNISSCINLCDTKASILLGFCAGIVAFCFSPDFLSMQKEIVLYFFHHSCFWSGIFISLHSLSVVVFVLGVIELLMVVMPRIILESSEISQLKSILFFGSIAKNTPAYEEYRKTVLETTDENLIFDDLLFQIHSTAIICDKKVYHQKAGLLSTSISTIVFILTTLIGFVVVH